MLLPVALLLLLFGGPAAACTCMIVTKSASADGNAIVTYAADSHTLVCLCFRLNRLADCVLDGGGSP